MTGAPGTAATTASERLAALSSTEPRDLPDAVRTDARWRLTDTVGVCLAGSRLEYAPAVRDLAEELGGRPDASTVGFGQKLPAPLAGFVNGALAHGADFDDTHSVASAHISCVVVPAALAMGERTGATGAAVLTAMVVGADVGLRIGAAAPHLFHARGLHPTLVVGPFAAAAVGARLLGLDQRRTASALGLAGSQAAGLLQGMLDGSWVKQLHPAWAVQSGLTAALLAGKGFIGPRAVLEGRSGLYGALLYGEEIDLDAVCADLGARWLYPETVFKPYPNGAWNHSSTDGVAELMQRERVSADDIDRIDCTISPHGLGAVCEPREIRLHPQSPYHMKFSLPYAVAMRAVLGRITADDYTEEVRGDQRVAALAQRVFCHGDPEMPAEQFPARVRLVTRDGRSFEIHVTAQRGGPQNPMNADQHRAKFLANAEPTLGSERSGQLLQALEGAWGAPSLASVVRLFAVAEADPAVRE